jgi:hypothetical protein
MVSILQRRSIRRRLRAIVLVAMAPLAVLNALPLAAGCICADGHYEAICHAGECQAGMAHCGCACCAHHSCCSGKVCCHHPTANPHEVPGQQVRDSGHCTPLVHQATPTIVNPSASADSEQIAAFIVAPIDLPYSGETLKTGRYVDVDTGRPPHDLVITLQRLVI